MASTPEGARLTEAHRQAQQDVRDNFLAEFIVMWALLDSARLDETGPGWVDAVVRLVKSYRFDSAAVATRYYTRFRAVEAPSSIARPRVSDANRPESAPPPAGPLTGRPPRVATAPPRPRRADGSRGGRPKRDVIPEPRSSRSGFSFDEAAYRRLLRDNDRTRIDIPPVNWTERDRAMRVSLNVVGPIGQKSQISKGRSEKAARDVSFVESSGVATRHVLTGGRQSLLTLLQEDPQVHRWIRVTDGDPCAFCAMLAARGPVYLTEDSAGFTAHDHCACTAEPVYSADSAWPGRAQEFHRLWNEHIRGKYSGAEARRQWRRLYTEVQREAARAQTA